METLKETYKTVLGGTPVDTLVRKAYARFVSNDVLRVLYYRQMERVFDRVLCATSNTVDIGCYEGSVLESILRRAPRGKHLAFEPIPDRCALLRGRFPGVEIQNVALSNVAGRATFQLVVGCDSHSGLRKREYPKEATEVREISVTTVPLDTVLAGRNVDLMKLDVEGAERLVLEGARETLARCRPFTIFQHGRGSAEFYDTTPEQIFDLFADCGMAISLMEHWVRGGRALTRAEFGAQFRGGKNYIFLGHKKGGHS